MRIEVAIGDVHGRLDKLEELFERLNEKYATTEKMVVMLGDYVDRGPQSAQAVELIRDCQSPSFHVLKGNHEQLMIDAVLNDDGYLWIANGGGTTITSYTDMYGEDADNKMRSDSEWMESLPCVVESDHRIYVHAGLNPRKPIERVEEELLWIRDPFLMSTRDWGKHVVHGHTHTWGRKDTHEVELLANRTNLDTAAFHTGILSAAVFDADNPGGPIEIVQTAP
jgi:serine/threonine protein phosphatase 1